MRVEANGNSGWGSSSFWPRCFSPVPSQGMRGAAVGMGVAAMASTAGTVGAAMASTAGTVGAAQESPLGSGHTGDHTGGRMGIRIPIPMLIRMPTPIRTPPRSIPNPHHSCRSSRPHHHLPGTTVTIHKATTPMSSSVPVAGERWPRAHNRWPETASSRMAKPGGIGPLSEHYRRFVAMLSAGPVGSFD
jgi:hypothetical protein